MKTNEFVKYVAPEVEIIEVMVEKGFALSGGAGAGGQLGGSTEE